MGQMPQLNYCQCRLIICHKFLWIHTHPFNGPFSGTTQVSRYQKGKTNLDFTEARDSEWQWNQLLGHMQVCTLLQTDNHTSIPPLCFLHAGCPSCPPPTVSKHWRHSLTLQPVVQPVIQPVAWRVVTCRNRQFSETSSTANHDYEGGKRSSLTPVLTGRHQGRVRVNTGILVFDWMIHLPLLHAAARHVPWSFTLS